MLVTLLVKFRNKDWKTTELGLLLQVLPVRIVPFLETLGSHLKRFIFAQFKIPKRSKLRKLIQVLWFHMEGKI